VLFEHGAGSMETRAVRGAGKQRLTIVDFGFLNFDLSGTEELSIFAEARKRTMNVDFQ
jgi:hypothetical protein